MVDTSSYFFGLKPNLRKSEIVGIGVLQGVQVAVCGMRFIVLHTHFSYNKKLQKG